MTDRAGNGPSPRRLYRDTENAVICGVCSGIADYFGFRVGAVRCLTVIACFFFMPAVLLLYIAVSLLVPRKPKNLYSNEREEVFWQSVRRNPHHTFGDVRRRFREMEAKLQRMERYVTSPRYNLDKEFRDLEG